MDEAIGPVRPGTDIGPEHQGYYVQITTVVTPETSALGLGTVGDPVTVRGTIHHAERITQPLTGYRVTRVTVRVSGHEPVMTFNLGARNPVRLFEST